MGISDRDYMRKNEEGDKKVDAYEEERRTQEYGDLSSHRKRRLQKILLWIIAELVLLGLAGLVASHWK